MADVDGMGQNEFLFEVNTTEFPGKVEVVTIEFKRQILPSDQVETRRWRLLDFTHPFVRRFVNAIARHPGGPYLRLGGSGIQPPKESA